VGSDPDRKKTIANDSAELASRNVIKSRVPFDVTQVGIGPLTIVDGDQVLRM
jgi:hypothetical protein